MILRKCPNCGKIANNAEELEWFVVSKKGKYGRSNTCKECSNAMRIATRRECSLETARSYLQKKHDAKYLRKCRHCGLEAFTKEELNNFVTKKESSYGVDTLCKKCQSLEHKARRYGVSMEYIDEVSADSKCAICSSEDNLVYDHCHIEKVGEKAFRGILCQSCNLGLGGFKDSTHNLKKAIKYLDKFYSDDKNHTISS